MPGRAVSAMKTSTLCVLPAALGLVLPSCGGAHTLAFTAPAKTVLEQAQTGAHVVCQQGKHSVTGVVPAPGRGGVWIKGAGVSLTRRKDGSLAVYCGSLRATHPR